MVFPACPWGVAQQPISRKRWPDPQSAAAMTIHHHPWPMMMFSDVQWGLHQWLNWFNHQWYNDGDLNGVIHNFIIFHMCPVTPVIYIGFMRIFEHQWIKKGLSKEMPMPQCSRMCFTYDACLPITSRCPTVQKSGRPMISEVKTMEKQLGVEKSGKFSPKSCRTYVVAWVPLMAEILKLPSVYEILGSNPWLCIYSYNVRPPR